MGLAQGHPSLVPATCQRRSSAVTPAKGRIFWAGLSYVATATYRNWRMGRQASALSTAQLIPGGGPEYLFTSLPIWPVIIRKTMR
jgi:hypothetical protein